MGAMYFGEPESMEANVIYDTGSTWLTVKSAMCDQCSNDSKRYDPKNSTTS